MKNNSKESSEKKSNDIEVVIGDNSLLNISEVGDCMNTLRPKSADKKSKNVIIPKEKFKKK